MEEQELIAKLLRREPLACRQLVQSHHGRLVSVARAIVGESAEDIVQEAWLLAFKSLPKFEGRSSLKTWLTRIVINAAYSRCRYDKTRFALSLDEVEALLDSDDDKASKEQVDMWKKRARERVEMDTEIEEIKRQIGEEFTNMKNKSFHRQKYPDGSYEFKIILEPASAVDEAGS